MTLYALSPVAATTLTDPTRPYNTDSSAGREARTGIYVLDSTLVSPHRRVAVINGSHVTEGETIGNATVLRIRRHDVVLQSPGKRITLKLIPDITRTHP